jgi:predicted amidohydrolase
MRQISHETGAALAGSVVVQSQGHYYNRFYFVCPDQEPVWYDKRHLFAYGGEDKHFTAGTRRVVVTYGDIRFLLQVCYDLRFPVFSRNRGDYDAILYVANWPESRIRVWETLLSARAIENQCFVIAANRVGDDPACHYAGGSAIIDAFGDPISRAEGSTEQWVSASLGLAGVGINGLKLFRRKFPVLADADAFELK